MKKIILILGPNAVGKSTTSQVLLSKLQKSAYIDADCCRAINPFPLTEATKVAVINNIYCMFRNYLLCKDIEWIVFPYSLHGERSEIWEEVLRKLKEDKLGFSLYPVILKCSWNENIFRARNNHRDEARIERGMKNTFSFYDNFSYPVIDTTYLSVEEVADKIVTDMINGWEGKND